MNYQNIITIEPGKRGRQPCIRRMRITVYDVLDWLAAEMSPAEILDEFPELTEDDIKACLEFRSSFKIIQRFMNSDSLDCFELYQ